MSSDFPYLSRRMPVLAENVVATSQPLASQAGLSMIRRGGNAVDAALAAAIALVVVEPVNNGLGSDAFAIVAKDGALHGLNASGRSPRAMTIERFAGAERMPMLGWGAVTVPGAVSAWVELSEKFGSLPFETLFEPAIDYAERGYLVSPVIAGQWSAVAGLYGGLDEFARVFLPNGRAPRMGERVRLPDLAASLREVAETRGESVYRGRLAEAFAAASAAGGGLFTAQDLADHRADWVELLEKDYGGVRVHEIPPNGQGIAALAALGILSHTGVLEHAPDSAESLHLQIEAMKLAFADTHRAVADPASMKVRPADLVDDDYLASRAREIDPRRALDFAAGKPATGDTVYLCAADAGGMMVSYIQSNYFAFGSGIVVPGTGMSLQNRGSGFSLVAGHPNAVGPGKRPFHTIIPGFVTRGGEPLLAFGVMGGPMQPQGHVQMVLRMFGWNQNPQAAVDGPRWQVTEGRGVMVEEGVAPAVREALADKGHEVSVAPPLMFGGAQAALRIDGGYIAATESRKDGLVAAC
ncbi:MAG TPA: gamma-glutamyltransferase family protein [Candidatus Limnocylindrales bacterium]|nr:gamma-glutamyltransferase family protein [Candidatus Limnocylindrales bacterium]